MSRKSNYLSLLLIIVFSFLMINLTDNAFSDEISENLDINNLIKNAPSKEEYPNDDAIILAEIDNISIDENGFYNKRISKSP